MISINYRDSRPIWEQVKDGLRLLVVSGGLKTGERLPSVRELAAGLAINPNTIQRAYRELENEGYIYSVPGKGSFAAAREGENDARRRELRETLQNTVRELLWLGEAGEVILDEIKGAIQHDDA